MFGAKHKQQHIPPENLPVEVPADPNPARLKRAEMAKKAELMHLELEAYIEQLEKENNHLRGRAIAAEALCDNLAKRERHLLSTIDEVREQAMRKAEKYAESFTILRSQFEMVSELLLKSFAAINAITNLPTIEPIPERLNLKSRVDMSALEAQLKPEAEQPNE